MADSRPDIRASDEERERVLATLSEHAADGRLTVDDLDERSSAAIAARTRGELAALVDDLPELPPDDGSVAETGGRFTVAVMGGAGRRGVWRPPRRSTALACMGGCKLDLREAEIAGRDLAITAVAVMGGVEIVVPEGTRVELRGFALMGGKGARVRDVSAAQAKARVTVRAYAVMGGVHVRSAPPRSSRRPDAALPAARDA